MDDFYSLSMSLQYYLPTFFNTGPVGLGFLLSICHSFAQVSRSLAFLQMCGHFVRFQLVVHKLLQLILYPDEKVSMGCLWYCHHIYKFSAVLCYSCKLSFVVFVCFYYLPKELVSDDFCYF